MFDVRTVLIMGAGASMPYKFPSGRALLFDIAKDLHEGLRMKRDGAHPDNFPLVYQAIKWFEFNDQMVEYFTKALSETMQPSIDAFLEMYPEYMVIGKVAIAARLIPHENRSVITKRDKGNIEWYEYFFNLFKRPKGVANLHTGKVRDINQTGERTIDIISDPLLPDLPDHALIVGLPPMQENNIGEIERIAGQLARRSRLVENT